MRRHNKLFKENLERRMKKNSRVDSLPLVNWIDFGLDRGINLSYNFFKIWLNFERQSASVERKGIVTGEIPTMESSDNRDPIDNIINMIFIKNRIENNDCIGAKEVCDRLLEMGYDEEYINVWKRLDRYTCRGFLDKVEIENLPEKKQETFNSKTTYGFRVNEDVYQVLNEVYTKKKHDDLNPAIAVPLHEYAEIIISILNIFDHHELTEILKRVDSVKLFDLKQK